MESLRAPMAIVKHSRLSRLVDIRADFLSHAGRRVKGTVEAEILQRNRRFFAQQQLFHHQGRRRR